MLGKFKVIGMAIFLIVFSGCGGGDSSSGRAPTKNATTIVGTAGASGSADGIGVAARFNFPFDITSDGTNLYVTDFNNHTIRKIVIATGAVTTIAGTAGAAGSADGTGAAARFSLPARLTMDGTSTNLYVTDSSNNTIRKIVIATGAVTTIAGHPGVIGITDGFGLTAFFNNPVGITTDGTNLYVADTNSSTIRQIVIATGAVTTVAGVPLVQGSADGSAKVATFNLPFGITTVGTDLYVADTGNNTIRKIH